ncbi:hypothetical protein KA078_00380 [Candidatus Woesebacteria bacterium]|nr:hypothetical protein [Candidatus Woesebacteria bacterium]
MRTQLLIFCGIILLAAGIRLFALGGVPHGFTWDEAAIGYNGYAIVTTRRDEWLVRLPLSFQSFGDYKAPLAIYINGIFTFLLGLSPTVVRLPFALAGIFSCVAVFFLIKELAQFVGIKEKNILALLGALSLAISPWHIHFSRIGFEAGISLLFCSVGITMLLFTLNRRTSLSQLKATAVITLSGLSFVAALYTYHSAKIYVPIILIVLALFFVRTELLHYIRKYLLGTVLALLISSAAVYPLITDTLWGNGATRAGVLLFSEGYAVPVLLQKIGTQFFAHFSPAFLFGGDVHNYRHTAGAGILYPIGAIVIGVVLWLWAQKKLTTPLHRFFMISLTLLCVGILPAALSQEAPHENRALFAILGLTLLEACGVFVVVKNIQNQVHKKMIVGSLALIYMFFFLHFVQFYFTTFASNSATDFQDGYLEAFQLAQKYEKGTDGMPKVEKILFTSEYGQPYIFALFTKKSNPIWYRGGSLNTYQFTDTFAESDLERVNTLVVTGAKHELQSKVPQHVVNGSDQKPRFFVYFTGEK